MRPKIWTKNRIHVCQYWTNDSVVHMTARLHNDHDKWSKNSTIMLHLAFSHSLHNIVVLQPWLVAGLQEAIHLSSCTSHALSEHLAGARNSATQNKLINHLGTTRWSLLACKNVCLLPWRSWDNCAVTWRGHMPRVTTPTDGMANL